MKANNVLIICQRLLLVYIFPCMLFFSNLDTFLRTERCGLVYLIRYFRLQLDQFRFFTDRIKAEYLRAHFHTGCTSAAQVCIYYYFRQ